MDPKKRVLMRKDIDKRGTNTVTGKVMCIWRQRVESFYDMSHEKMTQKDSPLEPLEREWACQQPGFRLLTSRTLRE